MTDSPEKEGGGSAIAAVVAALAVFAIMLAMVQAGGGFQGRLIAPTSVVAAAHAPASAG